MALTVASRHYVPKAPVRLHKRHCSKAPGSKLPAVLRMRTKVNHPLSVIRYPFTVYRPSHRDKRLKRLEIVILSAFDLSHSWLWVDSLKSLILCFYTFSSFPVLIFRSKKVRTSFKPIKPFQALYGPRSTENGHQ